MSLIRTSPDYPYRFADIYSAYRPLQPNETVNNFTCILSGAMHNIKSIGLDYCSFANNICVLEGSLFEWTEDDYPAPSGSAPITSFGFPSNTFLTPAQTAAYIQTNMNLLSPNSYTYTVTIDSSGYYNFTSTGSFSIYCLNPNCAYFIGLTEVADGRQIYGPSIPQFSTPLGTTLRPEWPCFNRPWGISIEIEGFSSNTLSNCTYNPSFQFIVPISSNYGDMQEYYRGQTFNQNIYYFDIGHTFKTFKIKIGLMIPGLRGTTGSFNLHSDIFIRFHYETFDDMKALSWRSNVM